MLILQARADLESDKEVAWMNLEAARSVVESLLSGLPAPTLAPGPSNSLALDLAMIHTRLADCSKTNGRLASSLSDYGRALELRLSTSGPYNQKVADTYYSLATVCTSLAAGEEEGEDGQEMTKDRKEVRERETRATAPSKGFNSGHTRPRGWAGGNPLACLTPTHL